MPARVWGSTALSLAVSTRVYAIAAAFPPAKLKDKAEKLEARKEALTEFLDHADEGQPLLHPSMAQMYQDRISEPYENLQSEEDRGADVDVLRSLTDEFASCPGTANSPSSFAATWGRSCALPPESKTPTSFRRPRLWTTCFRRNRWLREGAANARGAREAQKRKPPRQDRRRYRKYRWLRGQDLNLRPSGYEPNLLIFLTILFSET